MNKKAYTTWKSMLERAYSPILHEKYPTYKNVTVCEEWHNFQIFAKWMEVNYVEGWELDKDLISGDNKLYSPKTANFIPKAVNNFLRKGQLTNTSGYTGLAKLGDGKWLASKKINGKTTRLGVFNNVEDAIRAYENARGLEAAKLRLKYKGILPCRILEHIK